MDGSGSQPNPVPAQTPPTDFVDPVLFDRHSADRIRESVRWTEGQYRLDGSKPRKNAGSLAWMRFVTLTTSLAGGGVGSATLSDGTTITITNLTGSTFAAGTLGIAGWVDGSWWLILANNCGTL